MGSIPRFYGYGMCIAPDPQDFESITLDDRVDLVKVDLYFIRRPTHIVRHNVVLRDANTLCARFNRRYAHTSVRLVVG